VRGKFALLCEGTRSLALSLLRLPVAPFLSARPKRTFSKFIHSTAQHKEKRVSALNCPFPHPSVVYNFIQIDVMKISFRLSYNSLSLMVPFTREQERLEIQQVQQMSIGKNKNQFARLPSPFTSPPFEMRLIDNLSVYCLLPPIAAARSIKKRE
jgi:hypothetical protein